MGSDNMSLMSIRLPEDAREMLRRRAKEMNVKVAVLARRYVLQGLGYEPEPPIHSRKGLRWRQERERMAEELREDLRQERDRMREELRREITAEVLEDLRGDDSRS